MKSSIRVALIGDYDAMRVRQAATVAALEHAARAIGVGVETTWVPTREIAAGAEGVLAGFDAYFGVPGAVVSLEGALEGIRFARVSGKPYIGTCAGFQFAVLEYARNVMGIRNATSAEFEPESEAVVLSALSCQVAGTKMAVRLEAGTLAGALYGVGDVVEEYFCRYGISPQFSALLQREGMRVSGVDVGGEPRVIELPGKGFYLATLFVPQTASMPERPHPLLVGYLKAALG